DEGTRDYGVPRARIAVIYNGVDLERFDPAARTALGPRVRHELGITNGARLCVAVGSGFRRKGFDLLLGLWRRDPLPDTVLVLVGDDERLGAYRREPEALRGRGPATGPRADVEAFFAAADVVCVPSRQEAFGNVVLVACAAGVPVLTRRRAGAAELPDGALDGRVVDGPDDRAAIRRADAGPRGPDGPSLGAAARRLAERLPWAAHIERVEHFLAEVARER